MQVKKQMEKKKSKDFHIFLSIVARSATSSQSCNCHHYSTSSNYQDAILANEYLVFALITNAFLPVSNLFLCMGEAN
jgi:hypothetical protein